MWHEAAYVFALVLPPELAVCCESSSPWEQKHRLRHRTAAAAGAGLQAHPGANSRSVSETGTRSQSCQGAAVLGEVWRAEDPVLWECGHSGVWKQATGRV